MRLTTVSTLPAADRMHRSSTVESPVGPVFVAYLGQQHLQVTGLLIAEGGSRSSSHKDFVDYMREEVGADVIADPTPDSRWLNRIERTIANGCLDLPVDLSTRSVFQQQALYAAADIPRGEVRTYAEVAAAVGRPQAARAVGAAMARNPVPLLIPCHRVVPSSGGVGGYAYGADLKRRLLALEGVAV